MTIRRKLILAFLGLGAAIVALSVIALGPLGVGRTGIEAPHARAYFAVEHLEHHLDGAIEDVLRLHRNDGAGERTDAAAIDALVEHALDEYRRTATPTSARSGSGSGSLARIEDGWTQLRTLRAARSADPALSSRETAAEIDAIIDRLRADLDALATIEREQMLTAQSRTLDSLASAQRWLLAIALGTALIALLLAVTVPRSITGPIRRLRIAAEQVARGDAATVVVPGADELADLGTTFNEMARRVASARAELETAVDERTAELRRTNDALQESEQRYRDLYREAPVMYLSVDTDTGTIAELNDRVTAELGFTRDELLGRQVFDLYPDDMRDKAREVFEEFRRTGAVRDVLLAMCTKAGARIDVRLDATAVRDADGTIVRSRSTLHNVTALLAMETSLQQLSVAVEHAMTGISRLDTEGRFTLVRDGYARMLRCRPEDLLGRSWKVTVPEEDRHLGVDVYERMLEHGQAEQELRGRRHDGTIFHKQLLLVRTDDERGVRNGHYCFMRDITERKRDERSLRLMMNELDHRVKNTLASVISLSTQTAATAQSPKEFAEKLNGRIVALARTHEALARTRWTGTDVESLLRLTMSAYLARADVVTWRGPRVRLTADVSSPIGLVLHELTTNAAKYGALSHPDGTVEITWTGDAASGLRLRWQERGGPPLRGEVVPGFGADLVRGLIERQLGGALEMDFAPTGLCVGVVLPARCIAGDEPGAPFPEAPAGSGGRMAGSAGV